MLEPRHASSDEELLTGDECESSFDPMDDYDQNEEYASTFDQPGMLISPYFYQFVAQWCEHLSNAWSV